MKSYADDLALTDTYLDDDELTLHILKDLGPEYSSIAQILHGRDSPLNFEELSLKLTEVEDTLKRPILMEPPILTVNYTKKTSKPFPAPPSFRPPSFPSQPPSPKPSFPSQPPSHPKIQCQICDKLGHSAKTYRRGKRYFEDNPVANFTSMSTHSSSSSNPPNPTWYLDSCASAHVTSDLHNLTLHSDHAGPEEVIVGDGTGLKISHSGSTKLHTPTHSFQLTNVLCVPKINKNLVSVSHFCKTNQVSVEFFSHSFSVKDL